MQTHGLVVTITYAAYSVISLATPANADIRAQRAVEVVSVSDLTKAVNDGEEHILISNHLYISTFTETPALLQLQASTKSIQVHLTSPSPRRT